MIQLSLQSATNRCENKIWVFDIQQLHKGGHLVMRMIVTMHAIITVGGSWRHDVIEQLLMQTSGQRSKCDQFAAVGKVPEEVVACRQSTRLPRALLPRNASLHCCCVAMKHSRSAAAGWLPSMPTSMGTASASNICTDRQLRDKAFGCAIARITRVTVHWQEEHCWALTQECFACTGMLWNHV